MTATALAPTRVQVDPFSLPEASAFSWPPEDRYWPARKPVGGFAFMAPEHLLLPWQAYQQEQIDARALRGYLAAREMRERRCQLAPGVQPQYGPQELGGLLGLPPERRHQAAAVQHQLTTTGLLTWTESTLVFCHHPEQVRGLDLAVYTARRAQVPAWLQRVPVPRHLLQYLARAGSPGLIATACGVLLQCLRYRDHQCVAGGRVAAAWIAACFGLAERTAARGLAQLTALGWLATVKEQHRPAQGPWRVVNLQWDFPRVRLVSPRRAARPVPRPRRPVQLELFPWPALVPARREAPGETPAPAVPDPAALAPPPAPGETPTAAASLAPARTAPAAAQDAPPAPAAPVPPEVQAQLWAQATANLRAQGIAEDFLIRPVIEAEVERLWTAPPTPSAPANGGPDAPPDTPAPARGEPPPAARQNLAVSPQTSRQNLAVSPPISPRNNAASPVPLQPFQEIQTPEPASRRPTGASHAFAPPTPRPYPLVTPNVSGNADALPADTQGRARGSDQPLPPAAPGPPLAPLGPLPTLRNVIPADLGDVGRLEALRQQAIARGWLRDSAADQLNMIAAAVHARRVGQEPCRLFVALLRDRRWEVITQEDEDTAQRWLRDYLYGPAPREAPASPAPTSEVPLSNDARVVDLAQRVLPPAWRDRPFLFLKLQDPTWTPARWEQAQTELAQWRLQQAQANARSQLASLGAILAIEEPWEDAGDVGDAE